MDEDVDKSLSDISYGWHKNVFDEEDEEEDEEDIREIMTDLEEDAIN